MAQVMHTPQRYRGFILTAAGLQKLHERVKQLETQTQLKQSPRTIAERVQLSEPNGIHPITVKKILDGRNGVDKRSIQLVFQVLQLQLEAADFAHAGLSQQTIEPQPPVESTVEADPSPRHQNWSEAVNGATLCGRVPELTLLNQAIVHEQCRLVQILGMAGVGKTGLATLVARTVQPEFEFVIWKSLRHAPALQTVLISVLQFLTQYTTGRATLPTPVEQLTGLLIEQLQNHRCLLVLDHFDSILCSKQYAGYYRAGYEAYGELLQVIAEAPHQSCLIITSREKPRLIDVGKASAVRSLQLSGLSVLECQQAIQNHHELIGTANEWKALIEHYHGNPLALKTVAAYIQTYCSGYISEYLKYLKLGRLFFGDLRELFTQQFNRLSLPEQELVHRLALHEEPVLMSQLREDAMLAISQQHWLEGLDSLSRRSVLHQQGDYFSLDPLLSLYVRECLVEQRDSSSKPKLKIVSHHPTIA